MFATFSSPSRTPRTAAGRSVLVLVALTGACGGAPGAATPAPAREPAIATGSDVVARMAAARGESAPATIVFSQTNTVYLASSQITQRQRVLVRAPGAMRVDNLPLANRSGVIYADGRAYVFDRGRRVAVQPQVNPVLVALFDAYRQPPAATTAALRALGVDLAVVRRDTLDGRPAWVVGARAGNLTADQLWVDAERWVPLRVVQSETRGGRTTVSDTRFGGWAAGAAVPATIEIFREGRRALRGEIGEVRPGVAIPAGAFDTTALRAVEVP